MIVKNYKTFEALTGYWPGGGWCNPLTEIEKKDIFYAVSDIVDDVRCDYIIKEGQFCLEVILCERSPKVGIGERVHEVFDIISNSGYKEMLEIGFKFRHIEIFGQLNLEYNIDRKWYQFRSQFDRTWSKWSTIEKINELKGINFLEYKITFKKIE